MTRFRGAQRVVILDSPKQAFEALSALEGSVQDDSKEACASPEDVAPTRGPPYVDQVVRESPFIETVIGPPLLAR